MRIAKPPEERRAELLTAARALFDEKGVENTRVSDIVRRVGVAQGVFYYYFTSKQELVDEVVHLVNKELQEKTDALLHHEEAPYALRIARYIQLYACFIDGFLPDGAPNTAVLAEPDGALLGTGRAVLREGWVRLICAAAGAGVLPLGCPRESALALLYGLEALARESLPTIPTLYTVAETALGLPAGSLPAV